MNEQMNPVYIGFNGPEPLAIVIVNHVHRSRFKQVCYSMVELQDVFKRFSTSRGYVLDVLMNDEKEGIV